MPLVVCQTVVYHSLCAKVVVCHSFGAKPRGNVSLVHSCPIMCSGQCVDCSTLISPVLIFNLNVYENSRIPWLCCAYDEYRCNQSCLMVFKQRSIAMHTHDVQAGLQQVSTTALDKKVSLWEVWEKYWKPLGDVLCDMEQQGMLIDQ